MGKEAAFLLALLVENSAREKLGGGEWVAAGLETSGASEHQNARPRFLQILKAMVCSALQKPPARVKGCVVNPGTQLVSALFFFFNNLGLL